MDLLCIYYIKSIHTKISWDIKLDIMAEFKDTIHILEESENFYFIIGEKIVNSNLSWRLLKMRVKRIKKKTRLIIITNDKGRYHSRYITY